MQYNSSSASEAEQKMSSSCLGRAAVPVKRVWRGLSAPLGRRRRTTYVPVNPDHGDHRSDADDDDMAGLGGGGVLAGLGRLRKEVRTCEYRDVHVMWEMLSSSGGVIELGGRGGTMADDDGDDVAAAGKGAPATRRRRARKNPAPWSRLVTYCCGAF